MYMARVDDKAISTNDGDNSSQTVTDRDRDGLPAAAATQALKLQDRTMTDRL